ncbi:unnamed protein product [Fusarium equiseti]|uniref:Uncharacterized protein n=1 Tax=Fusarium equiseti TaxID=61235 RepID=A0A8J2JCL5_FUSEQ|nr:unnamed protein product [Fusarium equiseti]
MSNDRRSLTPIPSSNGTSYMTKSSRVPPPRPAPPSVHPNYLGFISYPSRDKMPGNQHPRDLLPYSRNIFPNPTTPRLTTPGGLTLPKPRVPLQELPLPARLPFQPTLEQDALETLDDIIDMVKDYGEEIVERAEFDAKWIEEQIQKLRDETDVQIKELEDEFQRKTRVAQESSRRLRALATTQKMSLGLMERWEKDGL